jgi:hypothetical protein
MGLCTGEHQGLYSSHIAKRELLSLMSTVLKKDHERLWRLQSKCRIKLAGQRFLLDGAPGSGINLRENFTDGLSKNLPITPAVTF